MEKARCLLFDAGIEKQFWSEAVRCAVYLNNRTESSVLTNNKTPAEIWYKQKPNLNKIRVFGSDVYVHVPKEERNSKLDVCSKKMTMMGYSENGYRVWDHDKQKLMTARNVIFDEKKKKPNLISLDNESNEDQKEEPREQ